MSRSTNIRGAGVTLHRTGHGAKPAGDASAVASPGTTDLGGVDAEEVDPDELRDFMAADWVEVKADPGFRERLRSNLWEMLRTSLPDPPENDDD